jgi:hypothetical protein
MYLKLSVLARGLVLSVEVAFELGAFGFDWYDRAYMNFLSLHASF